MRGRPICFGVSLASILLVLGLAACGDDDDTSTTTTTTTIDSTTTPTSTSTTSLPPPLTVEVVTDALDEYFGPMPIGWDCSLVTVDGSDEPIGEPIPPASVLQCSPALDGPQEGENLPVVTVLTLSDATLAVAQTDISTPALNAAPRAIHLSVGPGRNCQEAIDEAFGLEPLDDEIVYYGLVGYWFLEGRPARMDADGNGVPCETLFAADVVDTIWRGGLIGPIGAISPAAQQ
jgi:hypothetical protein